MNLHAIKKGKKCEREQSQSSFQYYFRLSNPQEVEANVEETFPLIHSLPISALPIEYLFHHFTSLEERGAVVAAVSNRVDVVWKKRKISTTEIVWHFSFNSTHVPSEIRGKQQKYQQSK